MTNNIKETWSTINQLLRKKRVATKIPSHFSDGGKTITDSYEIACKFNNFFVNVGPSLGKKMTSPDGSPLDYIDGCFSSFITFDRPNTKEVLSIIDKMKASDPGHDEIRSTLVKEVKFSIIEPLTYIFSISLETGVVPCDLKFAKVI